MMGGLVSTLMAGTALAYGRLVTTADSVCELRRAVVTLDTSHSYINTYTYTACDLICVITVHMVSIPAEMACSSSTMETRARLSACWEVDIKWDVYPKKVREVSNFLL